MKQLLVYLLTTSNAKGAHLRALFALHGIHLRRWEGLRGYPELQVESAKESLEVGVEHLRKRFNRPFIIEDTEVRIEAYSQGRQFSYPGFDVKRWWSVTTFEEIDAKCRQADTRSVSQSSTICLSLPGLRPFMFRGAVRGQIAAQPYRGPERPDEPWMNPREFGTIFVPDRAERPFAAMSFRESLRFDFRKRAVDRVVTKLSDVNAILNLDRSCYSIDEEVDDSKTGQLTLFSVREDELAEPTVAEDGREGMFQANGEDTSE